MVIDIKIKKHLLREDPKSFGKGSSTRLTCTFVKHDMRTTIGIYQTLFKHNSGAKGS
jgi:hypothetical protein